MLELQRERTEVQERNFELEKQLRAAKAQVAELKSQVASLMTHEKLDQPPKPDDITEKGPCLWCKARVLSNEPRGQVNGDYFHRNGTCDTMLGQKLGLTLRR